MSKQRIVFIDLAKGFCIILVVLYHVCAQMHIKSDLLYALGTFRMPLYFFLSGLFFKQYENFWGFVVRKTNKLLIPFLFFYLVTAVLLPNLFAAIGMEVDHKGSLGYSSLWAFVDKESFGNIPIWFLWCLFIMNIQFYLYYLLTFRFPKSRVLFLSVICLIVGFVGMTLSLNKVNLPAFIDTSFTAMPFFCLGFITNRFSNILHPNQWDRYLVWIAIVFFAITLIFAGRVSYGRNVFYISPFAVYLCGILGTYGVIFFSKRIGELPFVSYWGRYSIMILVSHSLVIRFYIAIFHKLPIPSIWIMAVVLVLTMFSYQLLIPLMIKYMPYVTAQKDLIKVSV